MDITRENYEAFFLDYHEGNLSAEQIKALEAFLVINPDLKKELDDFEMITIEQDQTPVFEGKDILKKTPEHTISDYDAELIAALEGDLSETQEKKFLESLDKNPNKQKDFELYKKTKINADEQIVFPGKSSLKKFIIQPAFYSKLTNFAVAAATVALLITMYFLLPRFDNSPEIANNEPVEKQKEEENKEQNVTNETDLVNAEKPYPMNKINKDSLPLKNTPAKNIQPTENKPKTVRNTIPVSIRISSIEPKQVQPITRDKHPEYIEPKTEFYWLSYTNNNDPFKETITSNNPEQPTDELQTSGLLGNNVLANAAFNTIEQSTGLNIEKMEQNIKDKKISFWDIAGAGLSGISNLTGTSLTINKENDENGRLTLLAIGDRFKIQR